MEERKYYNVFTMLPTGDKLYLCYNVDIGFYLMDEYSQAEDFYGIDRAEESIEYANNRYGFDFTYLPTK